MDVMKTECGFMWETLSPCKPRKTVHRKATKRTGSLARLVVRRKHVCHATRTHPVLHQHLCRYCGRTFKSRNMPYGS